MDEEFATFETIGNEWESDLLVQAKKLCEDGGGVRVSDLDNSIQPTGINDKQSDDSDDDSDDDASVPPRIQSF